MYDNQCRWEDIIEERENQKSFIRNTRTTATESRLIMGRIKQGSNPEQGIIDGPPLESTGSKIDPIPEEPIQQSTGSRTEAPISMGNSRKRSSCTKNPGSGRSSQNSTANVVKSNHSVKCAKSVDESS